MFPDTVFPLKHLNNTYNRDDGEIVNTSIFEVNLSTVSERKAETIDNSEPTFDETV